MRNKFLVSMGIICAALCLCILTAFASGADEETEESSSSAPSWVDSLYSTPKPTADPAATADPEATADPDSTADPDATETPEPTATPKPTATPSEYMQQGALVQAGTPEAEEIKVPVLLYHHISEDFDDTNAISIISPSDFRLHMTAIKTQYTPISLREYVEFVNCEDGSKYIPNNPIIVTFDDGYSSNYEIAFPILKELNIPATIFVVTDTVGARAGEGKVNYSHFTWEEAKEMQDSGLIEIQSHTNDHVKMGPLGRDERAYELRKSKYLIEKNLGTVCDMFAYPYGSYDDESIELARLAGYNVQILVGDNTTELDYEVNLVSEGVESIKRMTISGVMGNVNVIETIRRACANKVIPDSGD